MPAKARNSSRSRLLFVGLAVVAIAAVLFAARYPDRQVRPTAHETGPDPSVGEVGLTADHEQSTHSSVEAADITGVITGNVFWFATNEPAPGVPVIAEAEGVPAVHATSDAEGNFIVDALPAGIDYALRAYGGADGPFALEERRVRVAAGELLEDQDLAVWPGTTVSGGVRRIEPAFDLLGGAILSESHAEQILRGDARWTENTRPLPGVRIRMTRLDGPVQQRTAHETLTDWERLVEFDNVSAEPRQEWELETDAAGEFRIEHVPTGRYHIEAIAPAGAVILPQSESQTETTFVVLPGKPIGRMECSFRFDGLRVQGRVVSASGGPIANARVLVMALKADDDGGIHTDGPIAEVITDADGRYVVDSLRGIDVFSGLRYVFSAQLPGRGAYAISAEAEGFARSQMIVPMINGPLVDAARTVIRVAERLGLFGSDSENLAPGVLPRSDGRVIEVPDIVLDPAAAIRGRVSDTSGAVISGALLHPKRVPWRAPAAMEIAPAELEQVPIEADGTFHLAAVPEGSYEFSVSDFARNVFEKALGGPLAVKAGDHIEDLEILIASEIDRGSIRGTVIDAQTGALVESFNVSLQGLTVSNNTTPIAYGSRVTDGLAPGEFLFRRVSPGHAQVVVGTDGYPNHWVAAEVEAGREARVAVSLRKAAGLAGRVTRDGRPVEHASVTLRRVEAALDYAQPAAGTDPEGVYAVPNIEPADYIVTMTLGTDPKTNEQRFERTSLTLRPGETAQMDFAIAGGGRIEGRLVLPSEIEWGSVLVLEERDAGPLVTDGRFEAAYRALASTGGLKQDGDFTLEHIPAGRYRVLAVTFGNVLDAQGRNQIVDLRSTEITVSVSDGKSTRVDLTIR